MVNLTPSPVTICERTRLKKWIQWRCHSYGGYTRLISMKSKYCKPITFLFEKDINEDMGDNNVSNNWYDFFKVNISRTIYISLIFF